MNESITSEGPTRPMCAEPAIKDKEHERSISLSKALLVEMDPNGPWQVACVCCGYHDGKYRFKTWEDASEFRKLYCASGVPYTSTESGHKRAGIISLYAKDEVKNG